MSQESVGVEMGSHHSKKRRSRAARLTQQHGGTSERSSSPSPPPPHSRPPKRQTIEQSNKGLSKRLKLRKSKKDKPGAGQQNSPDGETSRSSSFVASNDYSARDSFGNQTFEEMDQQPNHKEDQQLQLINPAPTYQDLQRMLLQIHDDIFVAPEIETILRHLYEKYGRNSASKIVDPQLCIAYVNAPQLEHIHEDPNISTNTAAQPSSAHLRTQEIYGPTRSAEDSNADHHKNVLSTQNTTIGHTRSLPNLRLPSVPPLEEDSLEWRNERPEDITTNQSYYSCDRDDESLESSAVIQPQITVSQGNNFGGQSAFVSTSNQNVFPTISTDNNVAPVESSSKKYAIISFISIISVAILAALIAMYIQNLQSTSSTSPSVSAKLFAAQLEQLQMKFPNQEPRTWLVIKTSVQSTVTTKRTQPGVMALVATSPKAIPTVKRLAEQLAAALSDAWGDVGHVIIDGTRHQGRDAYHVKMEMDDAIREGVEVSGNHVILVERLDLIPPEGGLLFHGWCDHENAPYKQVVYIFTSFAEQELASDTNIEVTSAWKNQLTNDKREPLESRIGNHIVVIKAEEVGS